MRDAENIRGVEALDVDFLGFIFYEKSPRNVSDTNENIKTISQCQKSKAGVFVNKSLDFILDKAKLFRLQFLQLHGNETIDLCDKLRRQGYFVIKSFSIDSATDFHQTEYYRKSCDYFLFDTKCIAYGGSGKRFDWSLLESYQGETPFLLSGGLSPDCIDDLKKIKHPQFAGIDLNSGFEISPAIKDIGRLAQFIEALRKCVGMEELLRCEQ